MKRFLSILLILLMNVVGYGQASIPISRTIWNAGAPTGWTDGNGGSTYLTAFACSNSNSGKLDASNEYYKVNYSSTACKLAYTIKISGNATSTLLVEESADGSTWTTVNNHTSLPTSCTIFEFSLNSSSRYVRWTYTKTTENLAIDDVSITNDCFICNANIEIESILINSCGGSTEGENEMFRFLTDDSIYASDIIVDWPSNPWLEICQNSTTANIVSSINATITAGGELIEPVSGLIPLNSQVMFFTSTDFDYTLFDFSDLNYDLYVIFQCPGNTNGHFVNIDDDTTNGCGRTLIIDIDGCDIDSVTYDACILDNVDGEAVDFEPDGTATYGNTGGCFAPIFELPIELISFTADCYNGNIQIKWTTYSETNNDYFILLKSYYGITYNAIDTVDGAGNSNTVLNYTYMYNEEHSGLIYYKLKQIDFDGNFTCSDAVVTSCGIEDDRTFILKPNPVEEGRPWEIIGLMEGDKVTITDMFGQRINSNLLTRGVYIISVNDVFTRKLIVR